MVAGILEYTLWFCLKKKKWFLVFLFRSSDSKRDVSGRGLKETYIFRERKCTVQIPRYNRQTQGTEKRKVKQNERKI